MRLHRKEPRKLPLVLEAALRLPPAKAWVLILATVNCSLAVDLATGPDVWMGPVYLLAMAVAAWSRGWWAGQVTGLACMALNFSLNGFELYPFGEAALLPNLFSRWVAMSIVIGSLAALRGAYLREWWFARVDGLTGALNRQAFFELAPDALDDRRWRLLLYVDLDGLKGINDRLGHGAGDAWLRTFGTNVDRLVRKADLFARIGGDEFLLFMPQKSRESGELVARRLHAQFNAIPVQDSTIRCSVGALVVPPGEVALDQLVRSADALMYQAKIRGGALEIGLAGEVETSAVGRARQFRRRFSYFTFDEEEVRLDRRAALPPAAMSHTFVPRRPAGRA